MIYLPTFGLGARVAFGCGPQGPLGAGGSCCLLANKKVRRCGESCTCWPECSTMGSQCMCGCLTGRDTCGDMNLCCSSWFHALEFGNMRLPNPDIIPGLRCFASAAAPLAAVLEAVIGPSNGSQICLKGLDRFLIHLVQLLHSQCIVMDECCVSS